jgi:hypothetical protein
VSVELQLARGSLVRLESSLEGFRAFQRHQRFINVVKRSTVSTSQLRTSLPLHLWPINLMVYEGSLVP